MENLLEKHSVRPVVKGVSYFLAHVPSMVRHGSKPSREVIKDPSVLPPILGHLQGFDQAVAYPPNQVYIGNLEPDELRQIPSPWYQHPVSPASRKGHFGEIMPEEEFYGMLKICDEFGLVLLEETFLKEAASRLADHPLFNLEDGKKLEKGASIDRIREAIQKKEPYPSTWGGIG